LTESLIKAWRQHDHRQTAGRGDPGRRHRRQHDAGDGGRHGLLSGNAIIWPDSTRSSTTPHPSIIIGNKSSVVVGPGVFVGQGKGVVPLDNPNAPNKTRCAVLEGVAYCY
jgi:hypothetical protein